MIENMKFETLTDEKLLDFTGASSKVSGSGLAASMVGGAVTGGVVGAFTGGPVGAIMGAWGGLVGGAIKYAI